MVDRYLRRFYDAPTAASTVYTAENGGNYDAEGNLHASIGAGLNGFARHHFPQTT